MNFLELYKKSKRKIKDENVDYLDFSLLTELLFKDSAIFFLMDLVSSHVKINFDSRIPIFHKILNNLSRDSKSLGTFLSNLDEIGYPSKRSRRFIDGYTKGYSFKYQINDIYGGIIMSNHIHEYLVLISDIEVSEVEVAASLDFFIKRKIIEEVDPIIQEYVKIYDDKEVSSLLCKAKSIDKLADSFK